MKTKMISIRSLFIASVLCVLLTSCAASRKMAENVSNSRDNQYKAFVQTYDGKIYEADEVRLRQPLFGKATIELDKDVRIPVKEIRAYQNATAYMIKTPYGFAPRIKKGLINAYLASYTTTDFEAATPGSPGRTRTRTVYVYYLQKGDNADLKQMSPDVVEEMVRDYAPAEEYMELYRQTQRKVHRWSIINTSAFFGGLAIAAVGSTKSAGVATAGGVISLAGFFNGFVNKARRAKNFNNLVSAIDEYNAGGNRKKKK